VETPHHFDTFARTISEELGFRHFHPARIDDAGSIAILIGCMHQIQEHHVIRTHKNCCTFHVISVATRLCCGLLTFTGAYSFAVGVPLQHIVDPSNWMLQTVNSG